MDTIENIERLLAERRRTRAANQVREEELTAAVQMGQDQLSQIEDQITDRMWELTTADLENHFYDLAPHLLEVNPERFLQIMHPATASFMTVEPVTQGIDNQPSFAITMTGAPMQPPSLNQQIFDDTRETLKLWHLILVSAKKQNINVEFAIHFTLYIPESDEKMKILPIRFDTYGWRLGEQRFGPCLNDLTTTLRATLTD